MVSLLTKQCIINSSPRFDQSFNSVQVYHGHFSMKTLLQHCKTSRNWIRDFLLFRELWRKQPDKSEMQIALSSFWRHFYMTFTHTYNILGIGVLRHIYRTFILPKAIFYKGWLLYTVCYSVFLIQSNQFLVIFLKSLFLFIKVTLSFYHLDYFHHHSNIAILSSLQFKQVKHKSFVYIQIWFFLSLSSL